MANQPDTTKWTAHQIIYMEWLATPKKQRNPKTVEQLAAKLGYNRTTLWDWTKLPSWNKSVATIARDFLHSDASEIFQALGDKAKRGDVSAIKLALEVLGEYVPKQDITTEVFVKGYQTVSPDDWDS
jgi:hypothetical protein